MAIKTKHVVIGGSILLLAGAFVVAQKASQLKSITDKVKIGPVIPRIHSVSGGKAVIKVDKVDVTNQSSLPISVEQLYINIKSSGSDIATQTKPIQPLTIPAYGQAQLKDLELEVPYTNLPAILDFISGKVERKLQVSVRLTTNGFEIPFDQVIDSSTVFEKGKSLVTGLFDKIF